MMRHVVMTAILCLAWATAPAAAGGSVYTVNFPLFSFARTIADGRVEVVFPAPPDIDPAYWQPDTETLLAYQQADLILLNGASYAGWVEHAALPRRRIVDTSRGLADRLIESEEEAVTHTHGPEGAHEHKGRLAFTTWLDLDIARAQAQAVHDAMSRRWPEHADAFAAAHQDLDADLGDLAEALSSAFRPLAGEHVLASHPVYQYLGRAQGMMLTSFHWEPDVVPPDEEWAALDAVLAERRAEVMLWEGEPAAETRAALAGRGIRIIVFPTLSNAPREADFLGLMLATASTAEP